MVMTHAPPLSQSARASFMLTGALSVLVPYMTTLERTAYPTFKSSLTATELDALYTPSAAEVAFAQDEACTRSGQLSQFILTESR